MAEKDDWVPVSPKASTDDWSPVTTSVPAKGDFQQPGTKQAISDEAIVAKERGAVPDALKTALYSAGQAGAFDVPSYVAAAANIKQKPGQSFEDAYKDALNEQRAYVEALQRQHPTASMIGTGTGFVGGMFTPLGPLGTAGTKAAQLAGRLGAGSFGKAAASGATVGAGFGALSGASEKYGTEEFTPEGIAKSTAAGALTGGTLGPIAEKIVGKFAKSAEPFIDPATGKLTDSAIATAKSAFGNRLSEADIIAMEPQLKAAYESAKGATPEAATEALLQTVGGDKSRALVTGVKPSEAAAPFAQAAREKAEEAIMTGAEGLAAQAKSPFAAAESFHATERARQKPISAAYDEATKVSGEFNEDYLTNTITRNVESALKDAGLRTNFRRADNFPAAQNAQAAIRDRLLGKDLPSAGGFNAPNLVSIRQELNDIYRGAEIGSQDALAVKAIIKGFDNTLKKAGDAGQFSGDAADFFAKQKAANELNRKYKSDFYPDAGPEAAAFRNFMRQYHGETGKRVQDVLSPENAQAAQNKLMQYVMHPDYGPRFYKRLENAIGANTPEMAAINNDIIKNIVNVDLQTLSQRVQPSQQLAKQINDALKPDTLPVVRSALGANADQQIAKLRQYAEAANVINQKQIPEVEKQNRLWKLAKQYGLPALGAVFGAPHGAIGTTLGILGGEIGSATARGFGRASDIAAEKAGAPKFVRELTGEGLQTKLPYKVYPLPRDIGALVPPDTEPSYGLPQGRATGGRVRSHTDLMRAMEDAGKKDTMKTKPLLKSSDTEIAKALEIANQHI